MHELFPQDISEKGSCKQKALPIEKVALTPRPSRRRKWTSMHVYMDTEGPTVPLVSFRSFCTKQTPFYMSKGFGGGKFSIHNKLGTSNFDDIAFLYVRKGQYIHIKMKKNGPERSYSKLVLSTAAYILTCTN